MSCLVIFHISSWCSFDFMSCLRQHLMLVLFLCHVLLSVNISVGALRVSYFVIFDISSWFSIFVMSFFLHISSYCSFNAMSFIFISSWYSLIFMFCHLQHLKLMLLKLHVCSSDKISSPCSLSVIYFHLHHLMLMLFECHVMLYYVDLCHLLSHIYTEMHNPPGT